MEKSKLLFGGLLCTIVLLSATSFALEEQIEKIEPPTPKDTGLGVWLSYLGIILISLILLIALVLFRKKLILKWALIGGLLSLLLFPTLSYLEADTPWTNQKHDGICPLYAPPDQYVSDDFPGYFLTGDKRSCERTLEKGIITGDGQVFGGSLVCYNNVRYETNWKCITPILYYPIFDVISTEACGPIWIIFLPILFIYGAIIGFIIGVIYNWIIVVRKKKK